jgi:hypothetical protein
MRIAAAHGRLLVLLTLALPLTAHTEDRGASPAAQPAAEAVLISHLPTETWRLANEYRFDLWRHSLPGVYRTQGMAADGDRWLFSWQYGLEIADDQFNALLRNSSVRLLPFRIVPGIPSDLLALGLNHIGDIDYYDGVVYASLDSTDGYMNGHVALYRASNLAYAGVIFPLTGAPSNPKHDIASWVAVDGPHNLGYGKEWQLGNTINVYRLNDWSFDHALAIDLPLERIQGAKVHDGWLYMSSDNATRSVYRANLLSGHVEELFSLPSPDGHLEVEGMAVREVCTSGNTGGCEVSQTQLYVLMVVEPDDFLDDYVALYQYNLVPPPATPP